MSFTGSTVRYYKDITIPTSTSDPQFHPTGLILEENHPVLVELVTAHNTGNVYPVVEGEISYGEIPATAGRGVLLVPGAGQDGDELDIQTANGQPTSFVVRLSWLPSSAVYTAQFCS